MLLVHNAAGLFIKTSLRSFQMMRINRIVGQLKHSELLNALINHVFEQPGHRRKSARTDGQPTLLESGFSVIRLMEINKGSNR
jgi:hypothetical protein